MSIYINMCGEPPPNKQYQSKNVVYNYENAKQEEIKRRRLLRLKQVRQQSKNLAIKTLNNCKKERERQLAIINQIRTDEIAAWKEKFITKAQQDYVNCLQQVGQAHVAAEQETEKEKHIFEQQLKNRQIAARRGKEAYVKLKLANKTKKIINQNQQRPKKIVDFKTEETIQILPPKPINISIGTQVTDSYLEQLKPINDANQLSASSSSESSSSSLSLSLHRNDNLNSHNRKKQDNDDDSMSSSLEIIENITKTKFNKKPLPFVCTKENVSPGKTNISDEKTTSPSTFKSDHKIPHKIFNQVSDLIKKRHQIDTTTTTVPLTSIDADQPPLTQPPPLVTVTNLENTNTTTTNSVNSKSQSSLVHKKPSSIFGRRNFSTISSPHRSAVSKTKSIINLKNKPSSSSIKQRNDQTNKKEFIPLFIKPTESSRFLIQGNKIEIDKRSADSNRKPSTTTVSSSITLKPNIITEKDLPTSETVSQQSTHKVQFFDHANQFSKVYDQPENLVEKYHNVDGEKSSTAMLAAQDEIALDEERLKKLEELKKLTDLRCQKSIETENIYKDYQKLMNKLEQLAEKDKLLRKNNNISSKYSQEQLSKQSKERQEQMNSLAEQIFHTPVLITCPKISHKNKPNESLRNQSSSSSDLNVSDFNLKRKPPISILKNKNNVVSSEESCSSIILGHTKASTNNLHTENGDDQCRKDLNDLLKQIKKQKNLILNEKNNNSDIVASTPTVINDNKSKNIPLQTKLIDNKSNQTNKQQNIQTQTKRLISTDKKLASDGVVYNKDVDVGGADGGGPIQIVININGNPENIKTECLSEKPSAKFPKTPIKGILTTSKSSQSQTYKNLIEKENLKPKKLSPTVRNNDISTSSTTYRTIPNEIPTVLTKILRQKPQDSIKKNNNELIQIKTPALCQYITRLLGMSRASIDQLGVSTVSSVDTPSSSVINVTDNISNGHISVGNDTSEAAESPEIIDEQKMERLKRFISENHDFLSELDKSLQEEGVVSADNLDETDEQTQMKAVEMAFIKTLNKKEIEMKKWLKKRDKQSQTSETIDKTTTKTIAKDIISPKNPLNTKSKTIDSESQKQPMPMSTNDDEMIKHYEEITRKCNKRIENVAEMINKVREEKQKLLQKRLSTVSGSVGGAAGAAISADISLTYTSSTSSTNKGQNSTQYLDLPEFNNKPQESIKNQQLNNDNRNNSTVDRRNLQENLLSNSNVQIGVSRDSGIFISSRPMTASLDGRDSSPDIRSHTAGVHTTTKRTAIYEQLLQNLLNGKNERKQNEPLAGQTCMEPIVHVIEPVPQSYSSDSDDPNELINSKPNIEMGQTNRPPKPPLSFPSSMEQQINQPHELSTIVEVETPATSRINITINDGLQNITKTDEQQTQTTSPEIKTEILNQLVQSKFPTHEEYAAGISDLCDSGSIEAVQFESLDELQIKKFPMHKEYVHGVSGLCDSASIEAAQCDTLDELQIKKFPMHKDYVQGVSGLCDSASILEITNSTIQNQQNDTNLRNTKLNLLAHSLESLDKTLVANKFGQSNEKSIISSTIITNTSSADSLENEMEKISLNWASSMIKKTKAIHSIVGTSSTSSITSANINEMPSKQPPDEQQPKPTQSENVLDDQSTIISSNNTDSGGGGGVDNGKPLSLKEFLARELIKSSNNSLSSGNDNDSTLDSKFLRSLLSSTNSSFIQDHILPQLSDIHRTSTPVKPLGSTPSTNNSTKNNNKNISENKAQTPADGVGCSNVQSNYLFSGESGVSSIRNTSGSGLSTSENSNFIIDDKFTVPNAKLVSKKMTKGGGGGNNYSTTTSSSSTSTTTTSNTTTSS